MDAPVNNVDYSSAAKRAQIVVILLGASAALDLVSIWSGWSEIRLLEKIQFGGMVTESEAAANDSRQAAIGLLQVALYVATVISYLVWIHRANRNLNALGAADRRFTPGWAVGWWFIPIMNWFRPFQVVGEIWRASDPAATDDLTWKKNPGSSLLGLWWFFWIATNLIGQAAFRLAMRAGQSVDNMVTADWAQLAADVTEIPAAILCILVIREIIRRQEEKQRKIAVMSGTPSL